VSPGVALIRRAMLAPVKANAERLFVPSGLPLETVVSE
jgi:hypothetical protein